MGTIFEELRHDHDRQRELADAILETQGDSDERARLFSALKAEAEAHADAEERHFYTVLMTDDDTQDQARHSVAEHKEIDDFIEKLESYDRSAPAWLETAREWVDRLLHHLEEEEQEVFPVAGRVFSESDKETAALAYREAMDKALDR